MDALEEVTVPAMSPERFRSLLGDRYEKVEDAIATAREVLSGRVIWHVNSTAKGGGVAELLQSLLAYARGAGVDVRWLTISGNPEFFSLTKRLHNHLHESAGDGGRLGPEERRIYEDALAEAAGELFELVRPGDVVYIHDPQPAGLLPHLEDKDISTIWRCHVGVDRPGKLAHEAWEFLHPYVARRTHTSSPGRRSSGTALRPHESGSSLRRSTRSPRRTRTSSRMRSPPSWTLPASSRGITSVALSSTDSTGAARASVVPPSLTRTAPCHPTRS